MGYSVGWVAGGNINGGRGEEGWMGGEAQTPKSWMEIVWRQLISPHINLCRHMQGFAAFIASCMECLVAMQRLHSNICSRLQGFTAFIASCMECLVAVQQYMRNICAIYASGCRVAQHLLHRAWNVWWQCSYSTAIYASGCRACTALVQSCMEESGLWLGRYGNRSHDAVQTRSPAESAPARSSPAAKIPHSSI